MTLRPPPRYDPTMGYEDQLQFLGSIMQKTKSLGMTVPGSMRSRVGKTVPGSVGTFQGGWGVGNFRTPAQLRINPSIRWTPNEYQAAVDVHELGHADDRKGIARGNSRAVNEARGAAYERVIAPIVIRALGSPVPDAFWQQLRDHPYRKEFGEKAIQKQVDFLKRKFGASLYDREDARGLMASIPKARYQVLTFEDGSKARVRVPSEAEELAAKRSYERRREIHQRMAKLAAKNPRPVPPTYRGRS